MVAIVLRGTEYTVLPGINSKSNIVNLTIWYSTVSPINLSLTTIQRIIHCKLQKMYDVNTKLLVNTNNANEPNQLQPLVNMLKLGLVYTTIS